eukprot:12786240-Heterocapsa_arctica.AAC.1
MQGPRKRDRQEQQVGDQRRQGGGDRQVRQGRPRRQFGVSGKVVCGFLGCGWPGSGLEGRPLRSGMPGGSR